MNKVELIKTIQQNLKPYLPNGYRLFLFGSWARGNAIATSDIDIGILGEQKVPWATMLKIYEVVEGIPTLRKIDVVDLNSTEEKFKKNALQNAKPL